MKSVSGKKLCKIVKGKEWFLSRIVGSHHIFEKPGSEVILSIMKDVNLTEEDLL